MPGNTIYLITGANRGIGLHLAALLLSRPNTTVIGTVRSPSTSLSDLNALKKAESSRLITAVLGTSGPHTPAALLKTLTNEHQVDHIDVLVSNAGTSAFAPLLSTSPAEILETFQVNTLLPIALFQTLYPLLEKSQAPKFIYISSYLGSIESLEETGTSPILSYGISKAAGDFFTRKVHFELPNVVSVTLHPGWAKTQNGQQFADAVGVPEPPQEIGEVVEDVLEQIDAATRETTSGKFVRFDGGVVPW